MQIASKPHTRTVTMPWGPDAPISDENLIEGVVVRELIDEVDKNTRDYLKISHKEEYANDYDPSPDRIVRAGKTQTGTRAAIAITMSNPQASPDQQVPTSYKERQEDGSFSRDVNWELGEVVHFHQTQKNKFRAVETTFTVNDNGTLTYTRKETPLN